MPQTILRERILDAICLMAGTTSRAFGVELKTPVFIIGTGRCGTNLLSGILHSHSKVAEFPGEANELWHPKLEPFESTSLNIPPIEINPQKFSEISIANWPNNHDRKIRNIFSGFHWMTGLSRVFVARSAMISFFIPKILEIFPDAKFIHLFRSGPSVVESYFKKNFGKYSRYKYSRSEYYAFCANYWNDCILEIERRKKELSLESKGRFLEFSYEALCDKPAEVLEKLAGFLEIDAKDFRFDLSRITSQNYKADNYLNDPEHIKSLEIMSSGMKLRGYSHLLGETR